MIAVGVATILVAACAGALGIFAISSKGTGLPPQFGYGMLGLAGLCLLISVACFAPRTRSWSLPLIAVLIGLIILLSRLAKHWQQ